MLATLFVVDWLFFVCWLVDSLVYRVTGRSVVVCWFNGCAQVVETSPRLHNVGVKNKMVETLNNVAPHYAYRVERFSTPCGVS